MVDEKGGCEGLNIKKGDRKLKSTSQVRHSIAFCNFE